MMDRNPKPLKVALTVMGLVWGLASSARAAELPIDLAIDTGEEAVAWFPERSSDPVSRPPAEPRPLSAGDIGAAAREPALIPLPPAAWTGLAGLVALTIPGMRRYLLHVIR